MSRLRDDSQLQFTLNYTAVLRYCSTRTMFNSSVDIFASSEQRPVDSSVDSKYRSISRGDAKGSIREFSL